MDQRPVPVIRALLFVTAALAATACGPRADGASAEPLQPCSAIELTGAIVEATCGLEAGGQALRVAFTPAAVEAAGGNVTIDVLNDDGSVAQTMLEPEVSEHLTPSVDDVDGDGRADILIPRVSGNVNTEYGVWIFNGERGVYERVGDISGVSVERTSDGLIAVPARSSAIEWAIAFYKLDEGGLHPMATVRVTAPEGRSNEPGCALDEAPGLRDLNLTQEAAQARFCAEPAAQVFAP
jgi:hypothetical protein